MATTPFMQLDEAKFYLKQEDDKYGAEIQLLVAQLSGQLYKYLGMYPVSRSIVNETYSGDATAELLLDNYPVTAIAQIREVDHDGSFRTLNITNFRVSSRGVLWLPNDTFTSGFRNVLVDYTAGYALDSNEVAAMSLAFGRWLQVAFQDWRDQLGRGTGFSAGNESVTVNEVSIPVDVRLALAPFRRLV